MTADIYSAKRDAQSEGLDEPTIEWRTFEFSRLCFENAEEMALSHADWHEAAALIGAGATPEQVARTLL